MGPSKEILPGVDKKNFGCGPGECSPGGGVLLGDGNSGGDETTIPWEIYRRLVSGEEVVGRQDHGWAESVKTLARVSRNHLQSEYEGLQKPLDQ